MNEITRIHIAKVAYDVEVGAKKQLEKYIKSLETYTQDDEVLADIEIRITEILAERNVAAGGVISSEDITAIRKQLGEPYEFADGDGDIAVGSENEDNQTHRLYRSLDNAVAGGVLSGMAGYFNVNPLWTRLVFILLTFISFGFSLVLYFVLWVIIPPARTAAEKLQLAGKPVTLESIRELSAIEETSQTRSIAPVIRRVLTIVAGVTSGIAALATLSFTVWGAVVIVTQDYMPRFAEGVLGVGVQYAWMPWLLFWIALAGMLLLTALFSIIAYAFLAKKLTKRMVVTGVVIIGLGMISLASFITITATQSWRLANEAQSLSQTTKLNLPKEFAAVQALEIENPTQSSDTGNFTAFSSIQYIVDEGAPRYELTALPKAKVTVKMDGQTARLSLDIPQDYRNAFVQPSLTIYGPALGTLTANGLRTTYYNNVGTQDLLQLTLGKNYNDVTVNGTFQSVVVSGKGSVDLGSSAVQSLDVRSEQPLSVLAGTVRELIVTQPDVCPSSTYSGETRVTVSGVTSGQMTYNGKQMAAETKRTGCAEVVVGDNEYDNRY